MEKNKDQSKTKDKQQDPFVTAAGEILEYAILAYLIDRRISKQQSTTTYSEEEFNRTVPIVQQILVDSLNLNCYTGDKRRPVHTTGRLEYAGWIFALAVPVYIFCKLLMGGITEADKTDILYTYAFSVAGLGWIYGLFQNKLNLIVKYELALPDYAFSYLRTVKHDLLRPALIGLLMAVFNHIFYLSLDDQYLGDSKAAYNLMPYNYVFALGYLFMVVFLFRFDQSLQDISELEHVQQLLPYYTDLVYNYYKDLYYAYKRVEAPHTLFEEITERFNIQSELDIQQHQKQIKQIIRHTLSATFKNTPSTTVKMQSSQT